MENPIHDEFEPPTSQKKPSGGTLTIKKSLVFIGIFLIVVIMGFTVIMAKLINENSQCTSNPFVYGASHIESTRGDPSPQCVCQIEDETLCACVLLNNGAFWFDDEEIYIENPLFK